MSAVMQYTDEDSSVTFQWHGGEYIEVGYISVGRGPTIEFVADDVINVWDYEKSAPTLEFHLDTFEARCIEYLAQEDDD